MSSKSKLTSGFLWNAVEKFSAQSITFVLGIIIARLLTPEDYGIVGLVTVLISFLTVFVDSGFSKALIQSQSKESLDYNTVFIFNIAISICCYIILWFVAPYVAIYYNIPVLKAITRTASLVLLINSFSSVPISIFSINLDFKKVAIAKFLSSLLGGGVGVYLAYAGMGYWSLVFQSLLTALITAIVLSYFSRNSWLFKLEFSKDSWSKLFSFGKNILISSLLAVLVNNLYLLIIGKLYNASDLGVYTRGMQYADFLSGILLSLLINVLFPYFSSKKDDLEELTRNLKVTLKYVSLFSFAMFFIVIIIAEPLIEVMLTDKWISAVPILQIGALARMITVISMLNVNLLYALGRSDLVLRQEVLKIIVKVILLSIAISFGIVWIAVAELIGTIIHFFINTYYPGKILGYSGKAQLKDFTPIIMSCILASGVAYSAHTIFSNNLLIISIMVFLFLVVYLLCCICFKTITLSGLKVLKQNIFQIDNQL